MIVDVLGKPKGRRNNAYVLGRLLRYVHPRDKAVAELVRMVDGGVDQEVASGVVDNLVYCDDPATVLIGLDVKRFDVRVQGSKLACPILAHLVFSVDVASFPAICPFHFWVHARDYRLNVTGVEIAIGDGENLGLGHKRLFGVAGRHQTDIGQVAISLGIIHSISDDK